MRWQRERDRLRRMYGDGADSPVQGTVYNQADGSIKEF
jgi:hypothetical protein